jgi:nitrite reductase/ring-hydroxylating ferredoxin subunit
LAGALALGVAPTRSFALAVDFASALRRAGEEAVYPIPAQDGATIDREHDVIVVRYQDRVYAFALWCPHQRTALRWEGEERRFRCPKHKSTFQLDGAFMSGRATRALDRFALRRDGDTVVVDLSAVLREDEDGERWTRAVVQL